MNKLRFLLLFFASICFTSVQAQEHLLHVDEDGFSRCHTVEYNKYLQEQGVKKPDRDFERWMGDKVTSLRQKAAQQGQSTMVLTIPTVIHVIHRGEAEGTGTNISHAHVLDQIEQLNRDFRRIAGTLGGNNDAMYADTADILIEFCPVLRDPEENTLAQEGVNRVNALTNNPPLGAGVYTIADFDDVVKRNTIWNPDEYMNFWSADLGGGVILGYAQFPEAPTLDGVGTGNGDADTDGVVCLYTTVGGEMVPGSHATYNLGRTGTHEVGHWLGLRHIWGDGDCTADDFCADTPNAADSNGDCDVDANSCDDSDPNGYFGLNNPRDMVENYMDYSDDACMTLFTNQQRDRMRIVMGDTGQGSPRREILNSSTKCQPAQPWISFVEESSSIVEETDCGMITLDIPLKIALAPPTASTVTFSYSGTATDGTDYTVTNTVTFPAGITDQQLLTLDINSDALIEGNEDAVITITAVSGGGILNNNFLTHTLTIQDDDFVPSMAALNLDVELINANFENAADDADWSMISPTPSANNWIFSTATAETGNMTRTAHISDNGITFTYDQNNDSKTILFQAIDASNFTNLDLTFDWKCIGEAANGLFDFGEVVYSLDGVNFLRVPGTSPLHTQPNMTTISYDLPSFLEGIPFFIGFSWQNDGGVGTTPFAIDNVVLKGDEQTAAEIQTAITGVDSREIGANETIYFYNPTSGEVMLKIVNGNLPLGCTDVEVINGAGGSSIDFSNVATGLEAASKLFEIKPTMNASSATYEVSLYYTDAEIQNWITNHGENVTIDNFLVFKSTASPIGNADDTNTLIGGTQSRDVYNTSINGYFISGSFVGASGIFGGAGNIGDTGPTGGGGTGGTDLICDFLGDHTFAILPSGLTAVENEATINASTQIATNFELTAGHGITLLDGVTLSAGDMLLRIEACDQTPAMIINDEVEDRTSEPLFGGELLIYPNPLADEATISLNLLQEEKISIVIFDMTGKIVKQLLAPTVQPMGQSNYRLSTESILNGSYFLQVRGEHFNETQRIVILKN